MNSDKTDFQYLAEYSADIICRVGPDYKLLYVSPASFRILGWLPEEMVAMPPFALVHEDDSPAVFAAIEKRNASVSPNLDPLTCRLRRKDGGSVWMEITSSIVRDSATGEVTEIVTTMRDITERKLLEDQLAVLARTDGLTGLANRRAFDESLELEWKRTLREGSQMSLLLLDIDRFKQFNDCYGHQVGDDCLRIIAKAMQDAVRRSVDLAARYGGEEMVAILPGTGAEGALEVAEKIRRAVLDQGVPHRGSEELGSVVTVSIGVATALARHGSTMRMPESLLMSADHALYRAKREGRNRVATALVMAKQDEKGAAEHGPSDLAVSLMRRSS